MTSTPPVTGLTFETTIDASEARQAVSRSYLRRYLVLGLFAFSAATLFRFQRPWRDSWDLITDLISYAVGVAIGMIGLGFAALFLGSREATRRSEANGPTKYLVTNDGIDIQQRNSAAQINWQLFAGFTETKTLILLRLRQGRKLIIIPTRCVPSSVKDELTTILSNKLARLKV
jgi:hypothetical protein